MRNDQPGGRGGHYVSAVAAESAVAAREIRFVALADHVFARPLWSVQPAGTTAMPLISRLLDALHE